MPPLAQMTPALSWFLLYTTVTCLRIGKQLQLQFGNIVSGGFTLVLAKHTKHLRLVDILSVAVDRMQRNFEPMKKELEAWKATRIPHEAAKLVM